MPGPLGVHAHPPPRALNRTQGLRNYEATEHNIHRQPTPEEELQDFGREMGELEGTVQFAIAHPPLAYSPGGSLLIDTAGIRRAALLTGLGEESPASLSSPLEDQLPEAYAWNDMVRAGYIVQGDDGRARAGISRLPEIAEALRQEEFRSWFQRTRDRRRETLESRRTADAIVAIVLLALELLLLRTGAPRMMSAGSARQGHLRIWLRDAVARLRQVLTRSPPTLRQVAQRLVSRLRREGRRVVVNIGGETSPRDIDHFGDRARHAINLNPLTEARPQDVPNLVHAQGERIAEFFNAGQVDEIISNRLPPNTLHWDQVIPGAHTVLRPGGKITISFQGVGRDGDVIVREMRRVGFRNIVNTSDAVIEALK